MLKFCTKLKEEFVTHDIIAFVDIMGNAQLD